MKGVVFTGNRTLELQEFPDPTPGPGEVVLEIKASGLCGSDLKYYRSPPGAASAALGLGTVWVLRGEAPDEPTPEQLAEPDLAVHDLTGLADILLPLTPSPSESGRE